MRQPVKNTGCLLRVMLIYFSAVADQPLCQLLSVHGPICQRKSNLNQLLIGAVNMNPIQFKKSEHGKNANPLISI